MCKRRSDAHHAQKSQSSRLSKLRKTDCDLRLKEYSETEMRMIMMGQPRGYRDLKKRPGVDFFGEANLAGLTNLHNQAHFQI